MIFRILFILFTIGIASCNIEKERKVKVDDVFAIGQISKDTIFNGFIKFYDTATGQLVLTSNYKEGQLDGERIDYYSNNKIKSKVYYKDGKQNGDLITYDSTGHITFKQNFYYDLRVGPSIEYKNDEVDKYYFHSLENKELFYLNYDSIKGKKLEQLNDTSFFFWHDNTYSTSDSNDINTDLFLYLPNPPKLNFKYFLCIIDEKYQIRQIIKTFNMKEYWSTIQLDFSNLKKDECFAIRLEIKDEFDSETGTIVMFKKL